ncbi:nucleoside hydrolase [Mycobacterium sp. 236(2023)]|uniref:nucleoside hydrolase n=1 Tax=Mycobacterium sp. 236(2023) TaxID=3038163 RepID=UPI0024158F08|nr:nucleoside hydrolase [Mycobacterium sp. 236(2023)]MDG4663256.1 nucleoside hydrolase [Mycobacterium sp. 236(2023)]
MARLPKLLAAAALVASAMFSPGIAGATPTDSCVVIDTDVDIDDMMAIPMVVGARHVAAVVTTEGFTLPGQGASAINRLLAEPGQSPIPMVVGGGADRPEADVATTFGDFVPVFRALMNRLNNFFPAALPPTPARADYVQQVVDAVAGCRQVDVLVIGPVTSFVDYAPAIRPKIGRVVIQGRPPVGVSELDAAESFNCGFDASACETAFHEQLPGLDTSYVDVPHTDCDLTPNTAGCAGTVHGPNRAMVEALGPVGLPNTVKQVLLNHPDSWAIDTWEHSGYGGRSLFWDQSAALALLDPGLFRPVDGHLETVLSPQDFQRKWTEYVNLSATYA